MNELVSVGIHRA